MPGASDQRLQARLSKRVGIRLRNVHGGPILLCREAPISWAPVADPQRDSRTTPRPIFIFSITRSGSTLLQRVLATYPEVATVPEPWLLLPQMYALRQRGVAAEYTHYLAADAIHGFASRLPEGLPGYLAEVRELALRLYGRAIPESSGARYFLDKTPPYFFIADEVMGLFPEAKFIFLWRNPLGVVASLIDWDGERWDPARYGENLFGGIARLVNSFSAARDRAHAVRFEDLVSGAAEPWEAVARHLELPFRPRSLDEFKDVQLEGRMGDPYGPKLYSSLERRVSDKWKLRINNPLRKAWSRRYLRWIGAQRLAVMGYDLEDLLRQLDEVPSVTDHLAGDAARVARSALREPFRARARRIVGVGAPSSLRYVLSP